MPTDEYQPPDAPLLRLKLGRDLRALFTLRATTEPVSANQFIRLSGLYPDTAKQAYQTLQREGLVHVEPDPRHGEEGRLGIRLTPKGEAACRLLEDMDRLLDETGDA